MIEKNLEKLAVDGKLDKTIVLWGINASTSEILRWLRVNGFGDRILFIVDNFKYTFYKSYDGIDVVEPEKIKELQKDSVTVLFSLAKHQTNIRKQLEAYEITEIYNLMNLSEGKVLSSCELPYCFNDRSKGKKYLCYILAGYDPALWDGTLARVEAFQNSDVDYCLVSSGKYVEQLDKMAQKNDWSYLYTETNQVCFIQNIVISLHPSAEYIFKMDEDMFIGRGFFERMIEAYHRIEREGEYKIGFVVPVIPLNCCGYVSYLKLSGNKEVYEQRFGRAYRSGFSAVFNVAETAEFLWDTMETFDGMAERFLKNHNYQILNGYFNIGCILFSRSRWLMMGKWPEKPGESGMGTDEAYIYQDNVENGLSIYEVEGVLVGHLAFGHQKAEMLAYYREHPKKFQISKYFLSVNDFSRNVMERPKQ